MRNEAVAALLVVAIIASAGVGYFIGVNRNPSSSTLVSSSTSTGSSSEATQSTTSATTCVQLESAPLYLVVKNDGGAPIPSQPMAIQAHLLVGLAYNSTTKECDSIFSTHLWLNETGSDGKIELGTTGDVFNITTSYLGKAYHVNAEAEGAESAECVTLSLPSGAVNTTYAGQFQYQC